MKRIVSVSEVAGEGLVKLLGEEVILFCTNYNYTGILIGVNDDCVLLQGASIVFETGAFSASEWKDAQRLPNKEHYVMRGGIESFGVVEV